VRLQRRLAATAAALLLVLGVPTATLAGPGGAQTDEGKGLIRLAHFAPELVVGDIYVVSVNGKQLIDDVPYKAVSDYLRLDPGSYRFEVRGARAPSTSPPEAELTVEVKAGEAHTIAVFGTPKGASAIVLDDDMRQPASGKVRVRVVNAFGVTWPVDVAEPGGRVLADDLKSGTTTGYVELAAGPRALQVRRPGDAKVLSEIRRLKLDSGTLATVAVVGNTAENCRLVAVRDAAGMTELPTGGIATGGGGLAAGGALDLPAPAPPSGSGTGSNQTAPGVAFVGLGSGLIAATALAMAARRRRAARPRRAA
jgi:hypothetical protein